jgi:hypothetical protein
LAACTLYAFHESLDVVDGDGKIKGKRAEEGARNVRHNVGFLWWVRDGDLSSKGGEYILFVKWFCRVG